MLRAPRSVSLLQFAAVAALSGHAFAQNDDCTGALPVVQGANGPYSNAGSTTSFPWTCAFGGLDVWFLYVAPGNGSLTVDTCGGGFDTIMEVFDGSLGCGSLTSIGCNDDSCGLLSSVTVTVSAGTSYYIRIGGFASQTGSFPVNVNGPIPTGGTLALATAVGTGCIKKYASFYEEQTAAAFDLNGTSLTAFGTMPGYAVVNAATAFVPPSASATVITLGDDDAVAQALTTAFPYDGGSTNSIEVGSNGWVAMNTGNALNYVPDVAILLSNPATAWYCWHDYNPAGGGGQVKFEEVGPIAYITWDGVFDYGGTGANTWQFQLDSSSGSVTIAWQTMSPSGGGTGTGFLVGYSPGGASADPGPVDISATLAAGTITLEGADVAALSLATVTRPIIGTTWNMQTGNVPATGTIGVDILGVSNPNIPDLGFLGLPTCGLFANLDLLNGWLATGPTHAWGLGIPNNPTFLNLHIYAQSAVFTNPPANAFGAITSNGLDGLLGDY